MPRTPYAPRMSDARFVISAYDGGAEGGAEVADFKCDGVADESEINQAIKMLPARGGTIHLDAGTFNLSAPIMVTDNKRVLISGFGALLVPAAGVTALFIQQGISTSRGVTVQGLHIDGKSAAGTIGIELRDTNNSSLLGVEIENCVTGIMLRSFASGAYVEGSQIDNCLLRGNTTGVDFKTVNGTGSFMQTMIRGLKCTGSTTGLNIENPSVLLRAIIQGTFWIDTNQTAFIIDGNVEDATFDVAVEGVGGATGNTAISFGTNTLNSDQTFMKFLFTGTIATQVSNAFNKNFHYWSGGSQIVQSAGTVTLGYKRHGDTTDRFRIEGLTAGGKINFGNGTLLDTEMHRSAADIIASADQFQPASFKTQTKAGTPVDGDIVGGAADGNFVVDTTGNKIWVRIGGTWKGVAVA